MTDANVYKCDATACAFNYGQTCSAVQVELDERGLCTTFRDIGEEKEDELPQVRFE